MIAPYDGRMPSEFESEYDRVAALNAQPPKPGAFTAPPGERADGEPITSNWFRKIFDGVLERHTKNFAEKMVKRFATSREGQVDERLADRIRFEVQRRGVSGGQLDFYEPIRWSFMSAVITAGLALFANAGGFNTDGKAKSPSAKGMFLGSIGALIGNVVHILRALPRYDAGLLAAAELAVKQHGRPVLLQSGGQSEAHIVSFAPPAVSLTPGNAPLSSEKAGIPISANVQPRQGSYTRQLEVESAMASEHMR